MRLVKTTAIAALVMFTVGAYAQTGSGNSQLTAAVQKLESDVKADLSNSNVTPAEWQDLKNAFAEIVSVAHKPDPATVSNLRTVVQTVRQSGTLTDAGKAQIVQAVEAVLASAGIPHSDVVALKNALMAIYVSTNFSRSELQQLLADLRTIVGDLPTKASA